MKDSASQTTTSHSPKVKEKPRHVKTSGHSSSKKPSTPKPINKNASRQTTTVWCRLAFLAMGVELFLVGIGELAHDSWLVHISVQSLSYLIKKCIDFCFVKHENALRVISQRRRKK